MVFVKRLLCKFVSVCIYIGVNMGVSNSCSLIENSYETWFSDLLREALDFNKDMPVGAETILPTGRNSFFRQLDHMIAVLANEDFARLYELDDLKTYAELKDGVFTRYRKLAESLGALLLKEAKARKINAMVETSGRVSIAHNIHVKEYCALPIDPT